MAETTARRSWWCRLRLHRWRTDLRVGWNGEPMSLDPIHGTRECRLCGVRQTYFYDSQGGCWCTDRTTGGPRG